MHCKKCGALSGAHELCPKCRGWLVVSPDQRRSNIKPIKIHESVLQILADYARTSIRSTFRPRHERNLMVLDSVLSFCSSDRSRFGYEHEMMQAFSSVQLDCIQLRKLRNKIHAKILKPTGPIKVIKMRTDWLSWIWAMDYLASYRELLRSKDEQKLEKFSMCSETLKGARMFHNFTSIEIDSIPTNVCIHNSKAANGEGGTRVICFVRQQQDAWTPYIPEKSEIEDAFQISLRAKLYDDAQLEFGNAIEDIHRKNLAVAKLQVDLEGLNAQKKEALEEIGKKNLTLVEAQAELEKHHGVLLKQIEGKIQGIKAIGKKKELVSNGNFQRLHKMYEAERSFKTTCCLKILDLSYDDLYIGLCQLMRNLRWSDAELGLALLKLLGYPSSARLDDLATKVEINGIKVKDLVKPREDTKITNVKISGLDLCMSLMSIMFITEPKHSLPMAVSNLDALRALSLGLISLEVLFAPIEVVLSEGRSMFRVGSSSGNLGGLIASANNQRIILDPGVPETRLIKAQSMPVTELSLTTISPEFSVSLQQGLKKLTQAITWGDQQEVRSAAFFFPFIKCVALRAIIENAKL